MQHFHYCDRSIVVDIVSFISWTKRWMRTSSMRLRSLTSGDRENGVSMLWEDGIIEDILRRQMVITKVLLIKIWMSISSNNRSLLHSTMPIKFCHRLAKRFIHPQRRTAMKLTSSFSSMKRILRIKTSLISSQVMEMTMQMIDQRSPINEFILPRMCLWCNSREVFSISPADLIWANTTPSNCQVDIILSSSKCPRCENIDQTRQCFVYDIDIQTVLSSTLRRLSPIIEDYRNSNQTLDNRSVTSDIPFGRLYQRMKRRFPDQKLINIIFHLDGIVFQTEVISCLHVCLLSVELPSTHRYRRHNMPILSIFVGYQDPNPRTWLCVCLQRLKLLKCTGMHRHTLLQISLWIMRLTLQAYTFDLIYDTSWSVSRFSVTALLWSSF